MAKRRGRNKAAKVAATEQKVNESGNQTPEYHMRLASHEDLPTVLWIVHKMGKDYPVKVSDVKVLQKVSQVIEEGFVLLACKGDQVVGVLGLEAKQWWFTDDWFLGDDFFMMLPEHRGMEPFKLLTDAAKSLSDKTNLPLMLGVMTPERTTAKIRLFSQAMGGDCWGANFAYGFDRGK